MTKVIIVSDFASRVGGAACVAIDSALGLRKAGAEVTVAYGLGQADAALEEAGVRVAVGPRMNPVERQTVWLGWNRGAERWLAGLPGIEQSIIHVHQTTRYFGFRFIRRLAATKARIVFTVHDYLAWCPVGTYFDHGRLRECALKPMSVRCACTNCDRQSWAAKIVRLLRQLTIRSVVRAPYVDGFVFVSEVARRRAAEISGGAVEGSVVVNPVRRLRGPGPRVEKAERPRFVYLGRDSEEKGISRILAAAERVPEADFVLVGTNRDRAGKKGNVIGFRHCDAAGVAAAIQEADAVLFVPGWSETFGLVVAEAAGLGVASIVSQGAGVAEMLPADACWRVNGRGEEQLCAILQRLCRDREEARRVGANARRWFESAGALQLERHAADLLMVYGRLPRKA